MTAAVSTTASPPGTADSTAGSISWHTTAYAATAAVGSGYAYQGKKNQSLSVAFNPEKRTGKVSATAATARASGRTRGIRFDRKSNAPSASSIRATFRAPYAGQA